MRNSTQLMKIITTTGTTINVHILQEEESHQQAPVNTQISRPRKRTCRVQVNPRVRVYPHTCIYNILLLWGALVESMPFVRWAMGSTPALAATYRTWANPSLTVACGAST